MERRTLVRLLVVVAIGIPILIEAVTFFGLVGDQLGGPAEPTPTETATPPPDAVAVGEELLPATPQVETLTGATVRTVDGERRFEMTVHVENEADPSYELRLDALTTDAGTTVTGGGRTAEIPEGGETTLTGTWSLPEDESPAAVIVVGTRTDADGERHTVTRRVGIVAE